MSNKYTIRYLPLAEQDLISIYDYISKDSQKRGLNFIDLIDKKISLLENNPHLGHQSKNYRLIKSGYRVLIIKSYAVFYIINEKEIEIHRIIHSSRSLEDII